MTTNTNVTVESLAAYAEPARCPIIWALPAAMAVARVQVISSAQGSISRPKYTARKASNPPANSSGKCCLCTLAQVPPALTATSALWSQHIWAEDVTLPSRVTHLVRTLVATCSSLAHITCMTLEVSHIAQGSITQP